MRPNAVEAFDVVEDPRDARGGQVDAPDVQETFEVVAVEAGIEFEELVRMMVDADLQRVEAEAKRRQG